MAKLIYRGIFNLEIDYKNLKNIVEFILKLNPKDAQNQKFAKKVRVELSELWMVNAVNGRHTKSIVKKKKYISENKTIKNALVVIDNWFDVYNNKKFIS